MEGVIVERMNAFKSDLPILSSTNVVRRHLLQDDCFSLSAEEHFNLRSAVCNEFELHTSQVSVVGSAKLGFSIAPRKLYRPFSDESDVDVAIVSSELFDKVWRGVFDYWNTGGFWTRRRDFEHYLFQGWIRPDKLPPSRAFQVAFDWWEFFRRLTESGAYGPYKITGALYKSWHYFEKYQERSVDICRQHLKGLR